jgi:hypothetical protein
MTHFRHMELGDLISNHKTIASGEINHLLQCKLKMYKKILSSCPFHESFSRFLEFFFAWLASSILSLTFLCIFSLLNGNDYVKCKITIHFNELITNLAVNSSKSRCCFDLIIATKSSDLFASSFFNCSASSASFFCFLDRLGAFASYSLLLFVYLEYFFNSPNVL